ncbi:MAG: T9SS C-terminal target domain-containing protein [Ignavibacteriae bacterium]|nr:MAG: T9SS C-terminal target domain-containing protein [Ignavibacteriota bacterium]
MNHYFKNIIKLLFVFFIINSAADIFAQNEFWVRQPSPVHAHLSRCSFVDSLNIWAVGDSGAIIHTSNGGINWVVQNSNINSMIEDVCFINKRLGWALSNDFYGLGTIILKTTNGGITWTNYRYSDTTIAINAVYFLDSLNGYLGGSSGTIMKTSDAGDSWTRCRLEVSSFFHTLPITRFNFLNEQYGLAVGGVMDVAGTAWKTTDYGNNWAITDTTPEPLADCLYYNSDLAFTSGGDFEYGSSFAYSINGGNTWVDSNIGFFGIGRRVAVRKLNDIWVPTAFSAEFVRSFDSGHSFMAYTVPDTNSVYDAIFIDTIRGWAFGVGGAIYKYNNNLIGISNNRNNLPAVFSLMQNYPNPFNPATTIEYAVPITSLVRITLYDMLGREVKVLVNELKQPGTHSIAFTSDGLSSGVYFYRLESGSIIQTKKLVLLK